MPSDKEVELSFTIEKIEANTKQRPFLGWDKVYFIKPGEIWPPKKV